MGKLVARMIKLVKRQIRRRKFPTKHPKCLINTRKHQTNTPRYRIKCPRSPTNTRKFPTSNPKFPTSTHKSLTKCRKFPTSTHNNPTKHPRPVTKALVNKAATPALLLAVPPVHPILTMETTVNAHHHMFTVHFIQ